MSDRGGIESAACVGGGVIGAGWAARFLLDGVDVAVFDPDPQARITVAAAIDNARHAYRQMTGTLPSEGALRFASSVADAVGGADLVQESVPERIEIKCRVLEEIDRHARADALVASSTSGLRPTAMQGSMADPGRLVVAHPFNPVYLLPLVEIVGGERTTPASIARARDIYAALGMKPVVVRREIDGFVGVRLLEAVWREALWLIKDGVATVEELDDIIRYSFGLRWAQMGLFQTYRIAGGDAGMRRFIAHFGPCLSWPWTRLTEVPELDDELVDLIARQSDEQNGDYSTRELERIRDDNLVAIMKALARTAHRHGTGWGAGTLLRDHADVLEARADISDRRSAEATSVAECAASPCTDAARG